MQCLITHASDCYAGAQQWLCHRDNASPCKQYLSSCQLASHPIPYVCSRQFMPVVNVDLSCRWFVATMTTHLVLFLLLPRLLGPHLYPWLSRASHTAQLRPLPTGEHPLPLQSPTLWHQQPLSCACKTLQHAEGLWPTLMHLLSGRHVSDQIQSHPKWSPKTVLQQSCSRHVSPACTGVHPCSRVTSATLLTACVTCRGWQAGQAQHQLQPGTQQP